MVCLFMTNPCFVHSMVFSSKKYKWSREGYSLRFSFFKSQYCADSIYNLFMVNHISRGIISWMRFDIVIDYDAIKKIYSCDDIQSFFHSGGINKIQEKYENLCNRCGLCCGSANDPCVHLEKKGNEFFCNIYDNRFGVHHTISGKEFRCVPIREIIHENWFGKEKCAYYFKNKREVNI